MSHTFYIIFYRRTVNRPKHKHNDFTASVPNLFKHKNWKFESRAGMHPKQVDSVEKEVNHDGDEQSSRSLTVCLQKIRRNAISCDHGNIIAASSFKLKMKYIQAKLLKL